MSSTTATAFARALAARDAAALRAMLADDIDFRALTPRRFWSATRPDGVVDEIIFGRWFTATDDIRRLVSVTSDRVAGCDRVAYRLRVHNADGDFLVEQQAYYTEAGSGRIGWMRLVCSGYRPMPAVEDDAGGAAARFADPAPSCAVGARPAGG
jgi:hypothetical protein